MKITNHYTGATLFEAEAETILQLLLAAVAGEANLCEANLCEADLREADLREADLREADLREANLCEANLCEANLCEANLFGADLREANLCEADLRGADLRGADLCGADLREANLCEADLREANLCEANLCGANLRGADLCEADLRGADLCEANLCEANLCGARELAKARNLPRIPVVKDLDAKILQSVESGAGKLEMNTWHTCDTTHCRAGWAIRFAGEAGYVMESLLGPKTAGGLIYHASTGRIPNFFANNEDAMRDIREQAAVQPATNS